MTLTFILHSLGWLGSLLFAFCGLPQAIHSFKYKNSDGLSWGFLNMWFFGEVFTLMYVFPKEDVWPLVFNYALNLLFLGVIYYYKIFPARSHASDL